MATASLQPADSFKSRPDLLEASPEIKAQVSQVVDDCDGGSRRQNGRPKENAVIRLSGRAQTMSLLATGMAVSVSDMTIPVTRRGFIASALLAAVTRPGSAALARRSAVLRLWPNGAPGGGGPSGPVSVNDRGAVENVVNPTLEAFHPRQPNGCAVLVAAGGGYRQIENGLEAAPAVECLLRLGITAFVLTYRLPREGWSAGPVATLQDAHRAIRLIRSLSGQRRSKVSVLGFSAGGHLLGLASAWADNTGYRPLDAVDRYVCRPDGTALVYPVVTMKAPHASAYTRGQLLGDHASAETCDAWSVETHVRPGMPPTFLAHAADDPVADIANSEILAAACRKVGTAVDLQRYATGGHGFRMGRPGTASMAWPHAYAAWLHDTGLAG